MKQVGSIHDDYKAMTTPTKKVEAVRAVMTMKIGRMG
jgi:hypothetical protein